VEPHLTVRPVLQTVRPVMASKSQTVKARVPASTANLGAGFDVHSLALQLQAIEIQFSPAPAGSRTIRITGPYAASVTRDIRLHAAAKALEATRQRLGKPEGYALELDVKIPPRKGLGLSGAEAVGAVLCADSVFDLGLSRKQVARLAAEAEPSHHMDNVAASALGGFNIVAPSQMAGIAEITTLAPPPGLGVCIVIPNIEKSSTEATRNSLPLAVPMQKHTECMAYASRLSAAFAAGDVKAIIETLSWDPVVEPARADAGAYGRGIDAGLLVEEKKRLLAKFHVAETVSGAGPSRVLWYSLSEDRKAKCKNKVGLIQPAIELVSGDLETVGHKSRAVTFTKPTARGATLIRSHD
jgi:homoserine kinase